MDVVSDADMGVGVADAGMYVSRTFRAMAAADVGVAVMVDAAVVVPSFARCCACCLRFNAAAALAKTPDMMRWQEWREWKARLDMMHQVATHRDVITLRAVSHAHDMSSCNAAAIV